jgi:glycosyltransferase involved in cell wall biosynthesis
MQRAFPHVCFVGLSNLPVLAREFGQYGSGGAEVQQTLIAKALVRRGFPVSMVVGDYGQADNSQWDGITTYKAYRRDAGLPVLRFFHPRWTRVWAAMKRADADIYYVMCAGMEIAEVALFARAYKRKVIFGIASDSDCDPRTLLVRFWRDKQLYRLGLRLADAVLAQTEAQRIALQRNYGRSSVVVKSLAAPAVASHVLADRDISVLWVSNIQQLKRPDLLLELASRMNDLQFAIIGGPVVGHESLYEDVARRCATLANVKFYGPVPYHDVSDFYARARVFVNTSDIEGVPNSYLQAWAHGTPVVAFLDPNGVIATSHLGAVATDLQEMQAHVRALATDDELWRAASVRSQDFMQQEFGEEKILPTYLSVIAELSGT